MKCDMCGFDEPVGVLTELTYSGNCCQLCEACRPKDGIERIACYIGNQLRRDIIGPDIYAQEK